MSSFILPIDHIGYLVNLGYQLDIRTIHNEHCNLAKRLNLAEPSDRRYVTSELITANENSICSRYGGRQLKTSELPAIRFPRNAFQDLAEFAQALQWVRCFQYQSSDDPDWINTFAFQYTERLRTELETKIIACFETSWVYNGPQLTENSQ